MISDMGLFTVLKEEIRARPYLFNGNMRRAEAAECLGGLS